MVCARTSNIDYQYSLDFSNIASCLGSQLYRLIGTIDMESRKFRDKMQDRTPRPSELDEQDFEGFAPLPELKE
jgi:hypothetical protein